MDEERDCYYTLGLKPGASPAEIKSAFRRLAKLYHPDRDQSLDAEVKYREIRTAYKMLLDKRIPRETGAAAGPSVNRDFSSERTTWASADWTRVF